MQPKMPARINRNTTATEFPAEVRRWEFDMLDYANAMANSTAALIAAATADPAKLAAELTHLWSEPNAHDGDTLICTADGERLAIRNTGSDDGIDLVYSGGAWRPTASDSVNASIDLGAAAISYIPWGNPSDIRAMAAIHQLG
jgi:hypothetical protein